MQKIESGLTMIVKEIASYADMARQFIMNVAPYLLKIAQVSAKSGVYALAGGS